MKIPIKNLIKFLFQILHTKSNDNARILIKIYKQKSSK
jgi:hypothetical protein